MVMFHSYVEIPLLGPLLKSPPIAASRSGPGTGSSPALTLFNKPISSLCVGLVVYLLVRFT